MFVRCKRSVQNGKLYEYLQVVESRRVGGKVRQRVLATLGRRQALVAAGKVDGLLWSLAKFSERVGVVEAVRRQGLRAHSSRSWGPVLVFERLWERQGFEEIVNGLAVGRRFRFDVERAVFALVLQRLLEPGSDLQGSHWLQTVEGRGFGGIGLYELYQACGFLAAVKEALEMDLFWRDRDLFNQELDLVFLDSTSTYVYRQEETALRKRGYSRDNRSQCPQVVLAVAVDRAGWPIAWEVLPGNTADVRAFAHVIGVLRRRFKIGRVVVVADGGMISQRNLELLSSDQEAPYQFIVGCRLRRNTELNEAVLARGGRFQKVAENLQVKEVRLGCRRYVVCLNEEERRRDAAARATIVAELQKKLTRQGAKALVRNRAYARFLKADRGALRVDAEAVERDERYDGKFVLQTNTELPASEVATSYKNLWRVERTFRQQKSTLEVRPIYHHRDDRCLGHIVASFLALRLEVDLQRRLDDRGVSVSWPNLMRDLSQIHAVHVELDGQHWRLRTDLAGAAHAAFAAAGVRPPSPVTLLDSPFEPAEAGAKL